MQRKKQITSSEKFRLQDCVGEYLTCRGHNIIKPFCLKKADYTTNISTFHPVAPSVEVIQKAMEGKITEAIEQVQQDPQLARDYIREKEKIEKNIKSLARKHQQKNK